ncbi:MAG: right-handed parallel beta-helix repeat-containing protein, partial [Thermoplasmata archaeon]
MAEKQVLSLYLVAGMILSVISLGLSPFLMGQVSAQPDDGINGYQELHEDWTVTGYEEYTDEIIALWGDLTISNGGHLVLNTCTIMMMSITLAPYSITVEDSGILELYDCYITDPPDDDDTEFLSAYYYFIAKAGSTLIMETSTVRQCGFIDVSNAEHMGIYVGTNSGHITNTRINTSLVALSFSGNNTGFFIENIDLSQIGMSPLIMYSTQGIRINNVTFQEVGENYLVDSQDSHDFYIDNFTLTGEQVLRFSTSSGFRIKNIYGIGSDRVLRFIDCNNFSAQNIVIDPSEEWNRKIEVERCSNFTIDNVSTADDNDVMSIQDSSNGKVSNIVATNVTRFIDIWRSEAMEVSGVTIMDGTDLLRAYESEGIVFDSIELSDVWSPIYFNATDNSSISNLNVTSLTGTGISVTFGSDNFTVRNIYLETDSLEQTRGFAVDYSSANIIDYSTYNINLSLSLWSGDMYGENILIDGIYEPESGIEINWAGDVYLSQVSVYNPRSSGIRLTDCKDGSIWMDNIYVDDSNSGMDFTRADATLSELTFNNVNQDIRAWDNSIVTVMNSSINQYWLDDSHITAIDARNASNSILQGSSSLTWKYWVDVYVTDDNGIVAGAKIDIKPFPLGAEVVQSITGSDGYAWDVPVVHLIFTTGVPSETYNPHSAKAYEVGWEAWSLPFMVLGNRQVDIVYSGNTPPNAPTNMVAYSHENSSTILTWDPSTSQDVAWYDIYIAKDLTSLDNYMATGIPNATSFDTSYVHISASEDWQSYYYAVKANDSSSDSTRYGSAYCGDWVVNKTSPQNVDLGNITLNGTLWVFGDLELGNTSLQFGLWSGVIFGLFVNNSGYLRCENVTILREDEEPYFFVIEQDAIVQINGSKILYPGDDTRNTEGYMKGVICQTRNLTVTNSQIDARYWGLGIYSALDFLGVLDNITFYSHPWERAEYLLDIGDSSNIEITGLKMYGRTHYGLFAHSVSSLDISLSNISLEGAGDEPSYGIFMHQCSQSIIHNNTLILGNPGILILESDNIFVENSNISTRDYSGIYVESSLYTTIQRCTFARTNGNVDDAIYTTWCMYSTIRDIMGDNNQQLIKMENESQSNIENVTLMGGEVGIWLINSDNLLLRDIYMEFIQAGIRLTGCRDITLLNVIINLTINCFVMDSPGPINMINCSISNGINGEIIAKGYEGELGILIIDNSSITSFGDFSLILNDSAVVYLLNTSVNLSKLSIEDSGSRVEVYHYLSVQVYDIDNNIPAYANITIVNSKDSIIYGEQVNLGFAQWILIQEKTIFREDEFTDNPFRIYIDDGSHMGEHVALINESQHLDVTVSNQLPRVSFIEIIGYHDNPDPEPDYTDQPTTKYDIVLNYTYQDPENDPESGTIIHWYINGIYNSAFDDMTTINSQDTQKGQLWQALVYPSDGYDSTYPAYSFESNVLAIHNTPPSVSNVTISPSEPTGGDDLYVNFEVFDLDDDGLDLSKTTNKWYIYNFIMGDWVYSNIDSFYLPSLYIFKGQQWKCIVTPHDGDDEGVPVESQVVTIGNTPPFIQNSRITAESGSMIINGADNLMVQYVFSDADLDSESGSAYEWYYQRDGGNWTSVGVNSSILPSSYTQREDLWKCRIIPKDGEDFGAEAWTEAVEIFNTPPQVTNVTISPSYATSEDYLSVSYDYYDYDGDPENGTSYRWIYEDALGVKDSGIHGNVTPVGVLVKDQVWYCLVIPSDGINVGQERGSEGILIHNSPPSMDEAAVELIFTDSDRYLWLSYSASDIDLDMVESAEIRWYKNNDIQPAFDDNQTVLGDYLIKGDGWHAEIRVYDGTEWSGWHTTEPSTIPNTAPTINGIPTLSPSKAKSTQDLIPVFEDLYEDEDGDPLSDFEIKWYRDNGHLEDYDDYQEISWDLTDKGDIWYYKVRVSDGEDFSEWFSSATSVIENSAPANINLSHEDTDITITETESIEFRVSAEDNDGDILSYRWTYDGRIVLFEEGVSNSIYHLKTDYDSEGEYILRLVISDGDDFNETTWTVNVQKKNRLPTLTVVEPEGKSAQIKEKEALKFAITKSDEDGDSLDVLWYVDGTQVWEGSDKYTYTTNYASSGSHIITAKVYETESGANTTYSWTVDVEDVEEALGRETLLGQSLDWWGLVLAILSGIVAVLISIMGLLRVRKKKGALKIYMSEIDEISSKEDEHPEGY